MFLLLPQILTGIQFRLVGEDIRKHMRHWSQQCSQCTLACGLRSVSNLIWVSTSKNYFYAYVEHDSSNCCNLDLALVMFTSPTQTAILRAVIVTVGSGCVTLRRKTPTIRLCRKRDQEVSTGAKVGEDLPMTKMHRTTICSREQCRRRVLTTLVDMYNLTAISIYLHRTFLRAMYFNTTAINVCVQKHSVVLLTTCIHQHLCTCETQFYITQRVWQ